MLFDLLGIAGAVLVLAGLWWVSPAAAFIVGGLGLVAVALVGAKLADRPADSPADDPELAARAEVRRWTERES